MASINTSPWGRSIRIAENYQRYEYNNSESHLSVKINIFTGKDKKTEIYVKTDDLNKYLEIVAVAQESVPKKDKYYFDSLYYGFLKNEKDLCTIENVKNMFDAFSRYQRLIQDTFLKENLMHFDNYETSKEMFGNIKETLTILKKIDPSVTEIQQDMDSIQKALS